MTLSLFVGNLAPPVTDTITVNSAPFNLTGSTVKFKMRSMATDLIKVNRAATIVTPATSGQVQFDWLTTDTDTAGLYRAWWEVTLAGGQIQDSPEFLVEVTAHDESLTLEILRKQVECGLDDVALAEILVGAAEDVLSRFRDDTQITTRLMGNAQSSIRLPRPAASVSSIIERNEQNFLIFTLTSVDWELLNDNRTLVRLAGGAWARQYWADVVDIVYTPRPEAIRRKRVIIDLVKLEVQYSGLGDESIGDYKSTSQDYLKERERIMGSMRAGRFRFA